MKYKTVKYLLMLVPGCWSLNPLHIEYNSPIEFTVYMNEVPVLVNKDVHVSRNFDLLKYSEGSLITTNVSALEGKDIHGKHCVQICTEPNFVFDKKFCLECLMNINKTIKTVSN